MSYRYLLWFFVVSLAAKKPVGLEWRNNCCSHAAVVQLLYGLDAFRDFIVKNRSLIERRAPETTLEALVGVFSLIQNAENTGQEMVSYSDLEPFYKKLGLTGQFSDAFGEVLEPLLHRVNDELLKYLQNLWPEFKKLFIIEFKYKNSLPEYRILFPISRTGVVDEASNGELHTIIFPHYQVVYGGLDTMRDPLALSLSPYDQFSGIGQLAVVPRGSYELVGAFRVTGAHVTALRNEGVWYFCNGKNVSEVSIESLEADYQNLSWRFYAYEPLADTLQDFGSALTQLFDRLS